MDGFNVFNIVALLGGLALFIYGMIVMGQGLEKVAGARLQKIIETLTGSVLKGVLVGAVVTGVIQSSSATTVMVVGFVNAGIMSLAQAVGVLWGPTSAPPLRLS
jgi:phosphate:Na+ symporter